MPSKDHIHSRTEGRRSEAGKLLVGFAESHPQSQRLAAELGLSCLAVDVHRFPDGESKVRLPLPLAEHVIVYRSLDHPNDKLIELLLLAATAREAGVTRLSLVAPYLCYMRQDIAFRPGEAVSQRIVGKLLAELFDDVITVDPHLHRVTNLAEAIPAGCAVALCSAAPMGEFLSRRLHKPVLLGPDAESAQWVQAVAAAGGLEYAVAHKVRHGDRQVDVRLPEFDFRGRTVVMVDDVISTGHTVARAAAELKTAGAGELYCLVTHALCATGADALLRDAGVVKLWSSDSINHASNAVHLCGLLADAVRALPDQA